MTPRRWTRNTRAWVYGYLALRDGEQCAICHAIPTTTNNNRLRTNSLVSPTAQNHNISRTNPNRVSTARNVSTTRNQDVPRTNSLVSSTTQNTLDIDHIDGNPKNNNPDNLRLLCRRCNVATSNKSNPRKSHSSDLCVCVRERKKRGGRPTTRTARDDADYREASPEMQANLTYEATFRSWIMATITTHGFYDRITATNEGAELVGCSPATTARYLLKLTSPSGPLTEIRDALGYSVLILKPHLQTRRPQRSQR
jgi:hypothetical protein